MYELLHKPVLLKEVLELLVVNKNGIYVDGTVGTGGHAIGILKMLGENGKLIAIDRDPKALETAKAVLADYSQKIIFIRDRFSKIHENLLSLNITKVEGILLDLGMSVSQIHSSGKGFSFLRDEPLDMRMDPDISLTADKVINTYREKELEKIFKDFGEEEKAKKIAKAIVSERKVKRIETSRELADIVSRVKSVKHSKIHPATKIFMALRIYINDELNELRSFLETSPKLLTHKGRLSIISYHSLEDRIVKTAFKIMEKSGFKVLTKKPIRATKDEIKENLSARSAKMRVIERSSYG